MNIKVLYIWPIFLLISCSNHKNIQQLELVKAYQIETNNSLEPSGITEWDGVFYTVSDKHNTIYQLVFDESNVRFIPFIEIRSQDDFVFDFEGITHDNNFFYLISENTFRILKVSKDGQHQEWFPDNNEIEIVGKKRRARNTNGTACEACNIDVNIGPAEV